MSQSKYYLQRMIIPILIRVKPLTIIKLKTDQYPSLYVIPPTKSSINAKVKNVKIKITFVAYLKIGSLVKISEVIIPPIMPASIYKTPKILASRDVYPYGRRIYSRIDGKL